jgi:hypothetical protein
MYFSIDGVCGDGAVPHDTVSAKDLSVPGRSIPTGVFPKGLVRPSPCFQWLQDGSSRSILLALSQGHILGWLDANRLKDGLRQVLWDPAQLKRTLVEAIQSVTVQQGHVLDKGIAWRRMEVEIVLRDPTCTPETWDRIGILDAFGSVLFAFVRDATEIGSRSGLRVRVEPAGIDLEYEGTP